MQPDRQDQVTEIPSISNHLVGVRGPRAAQRARALRLATVEADDLPSPADELRTEPLAQPVARGTPTALPHPPEVESVGVPAKPRKGRRLLLGAAAAIVLAVGGWYGE